MKLRKVYLFFVWIILAIILPLPLIDLLNIGLVDSHNNLITYDFGILAYVWWLAIVYLATRPRWIVDYIGMPSTYLMHGLLGVFALIAATIHKFTASSYHAIIRNTGNIAWYLAIAMIIYAVIFLSGWLTDRSSTLRKVKAQLEKVFHHQLSVWIHRLNFVIIALIWLHVNVIPRIANVPYFTLVFDLYTLVFLALYVYQKFITDANMKNGGEVIENIALTNQIRKITIALNQKAKAYHAGDFYFVSFRDKNFSSEAHPFSVLSKPNDKTLELMINQIGDFTKKVGQVKVGTKVHLDGPYGLFDGEVKESKQPIVLYALGTGIAPLLSLAEEYVGQKELHLIWSINSANNYLAGRLDDLEDDGVKVDTKQHRFTEEELKQILSDEEIKHANFFIVGSANVVLNVRNNLHLLGVKMSQLHDEHLTM